jgi:NCK-associated protein 1
LDLIVTYVSLLILLSKVEDRKIVLGLFNIAHEMIHSKEATSFPRLGQLIMDFDTNPMKKLIEDFVPHSKLVYAALQSLTNVYKFRNSTSNDLRHNLIFNFTCQYNLATQPSFRENIYLDCLSFEQIERWICCKFDRLKYEFNSFLVSLFLSVFFYKLLVHYV